MRTEFQNSVLIYGGKTRGEGANLMAREQIQRMTNIYGIWHKPEDAFLKGDKVLVRDYDDETWERAYFHSFISDANTVCKCFIKGQTEWTSYRKTRVWEYCKREEQTNGKRTRSSSI